MIEDQPVVETGAPPAETEVAHVDGKIPLPEYLRRENLESLLPGEIVYLYPSFVQFYDDQSTLLINTDTEVREENKQLQTYTHDKSTRLALMPFLKKDGTTGYAIDASGIKPGGISMNRAAPRDESDAVPPHYVVPDVIAFTNLDGAMELHGDPEYFEHLRFLIAAYKEAIDKNSLPTDKPGTNQDVEHTSDDTPSDLHDLKEAEHEGDEALLEPVSHDDGPTLGDLSLSHGDDSVEPATSAE